MTGNFDANNKDFSAHETTKVVSVTTTTSVRHDGPDIKDNRGSYEDRDSSTVTDTVAAVVSAVLALVFIILIVCIIRVIRKRRRERQGNRLNQPVVHTIATSAFAPNMAAYRNVPISGRLSWESVSTSQAPIPRSQDLEESLSSSPGRSRDTTSSSSPPSQTVIVSALLHQEPMPSSSAGTSSAISDSTSHAASHHLSSYSLPSSSSATFAAAKTSSSNLPSTSTEATSRQYSPSTSPTQNGQSLPRTDLHHGQVISQDNEITELPS